jgi:hypothetical protein
VLFIFIGHPAFTVSVIVGDIGVVVILIIPMRHPGEWLENIGFFNTEALNDRINSPRTAGHFTSILKLNG